MTILCRLPSKQTLHQSRLPTAWHAYQTCPGQQSWTCIGAVAANALLVVEGKACCRKIGEGGWCKLLCLCSRRQQQQDGLLLLEAGSSSCERRCCRRLRRLRPPHEQHGLQRSLEAWQSASQVSLWMTILLTIFFIPFIISLLHVNSCSPLEPNRNRRVWINQVIQQLT